MRFPIHSDHDDDDDGQVERKTTIQATVIFIPLDHIKLYSFCIVCLFMYASFGPLFAAKTFTLVPRFLRDDRMDHSFSSQVICDKRAEIV